MRTKGDCWHSSQRARGFPEVVYVWNDVESLGKKDNDDAIKTASTHLACLQKIFRTTHTFFNLIDYFGKRNTIWCDFKGIFLKSSFLLRWRRLRTERRHLLEQSVVPGETNVHMCWCADFWRFAPSLWRLTKSNIIAYCW